MSRFRFLPVGSEALLVEVADVAAAQATYRLIRRLAAEGDLDLEPPRDVVPAARTVLLDGLIDLPGWQRALSDHADSATTLTSARDSERVVDIATRYDGADLDVVASTWGCGVDEVVSRHLAASFTVAFCGFAPGFAYCTSDLSMPAVARRDKPRASVPAGSVALAGEYCGVYPRAMPGGWQLIGTSAATLFDPRSDDPALLKPGDRVRFTVA